MKKYKFPVWRKIKIGGWVACCALLSASCNSFLDIVPDNVAVIDHAFSNAMEAEKYLFTCYSYLPGTGEPSGNIGMTAGDEIWLNMPNHVPSPAWDYIAKGVRSADRSQPDWWKGSDYAFSLFMGIRDCNTFLENIEDTSKVADLTVDTAGRTAQRNGRTLELSAREYALLEYLMRNKGVILSRQQIENNLWSLDYAGGTNVVDVYISYLRKKLELPGEARLLHTVRGMGWVLKEDA